MHLQGAYALLAWGRGVLVAVACQVKKYISPSLEILPIWFFFGTCGCTPVPALLLQAPQDPWTFLQWCLSQAGLTGGCSGGHLRAKGWQGGSSCAPGVAPTAQRRVSRAGYRAEIAGLTSKGVVWAFFSAFKTAPSSGLHEHCALPEGLLTAGAGGRPARQHCLRPLPAPGCCFPALGCSGWSWGLRGPKPS